VDVERVGGSHDDGPLSTGEDAAMPEAGPWAASRAARRLAGLIRSRRDAEPERPCLLVAVDGLGGAGKSTLAAFLASRLPGDVTVVHTDDFAGPRVSGWDWARFLREVADPLRRGEAGRYRRYDWDEDRPAEWHDVPCRGVVLVEGVSSTRRELGVAWDLTVWVETPREVRLARGVARDGEAMRWKWEEVWQPEEDRYVAEQGPDRRADVVIRGTGT
jgi:uridine kinase